MAKFPNIQSSFEMLPSDESDRLESLLEIFGHHLVWSRNMVLSTIKDRLSSSDERRALSNDILAVYENVSTRSNEQQELLMEIVKESTDLLLWNLLALFTNIGPDLKLDEAHAIWYKVILQISDIDSRDVVEEKVINRGKKHFLPDYLPKWLEKYGEFKTKKT